MVPEITPESGQLGIRRLARQATAMSSELSVPNLITLARLFCVPLAIWLITGQQYAAAFWIFVAAGVSDGIDGYIAKRFDQRTRLGALLDPIADKALLTGVYLTLGYAGYLPAWLVVLVVGRDVLIVAGFVLLQTIAAKAHLGPLLISKLNTVMQIALVGFVLARLGLGIDEGALTPVLMWATAVTTLASGFSYLARLARILARSEPAW